MCNTILLKKKDRNKLHVLYLGQDMEKMPPYKHWLGAFSTYDPDVSICIVSRSLSLVMTLKMVNAFYLSI